MTESARLFLDWVHQQRIWDKAAHTASDTCVYFDLEGGYATVTIIPFNADYDMCELRVIRVGALDPCFRTLFVIKDAWRPQDLFREMASAIELAFESGMTKIYIVSRDYGIAIRMKHLLEEASIAHSIPYEFFPLTVSEALEKKFCANVVLLLPDAAEMHNELYHLNRTSIICTLPDHLGLNDPDESFEILLETLCEVDFLQEHLVRSKAVRPVAHRGAALVLHVMYYDRCVRIGYRIYEGGEVQRSGSVTKARLEMADIDDLLETLGVTGYPTSSLSVICLTFPGIVNFCSMNLPSLGDRDEEIAEKIKRRWHVPVILENNTNAAAYGLYMLDPEHDSITLYRHQFGHRNGGQGTVIKGHLVKGLYNLAGEPKFFEQRFSYDEGYIANTWTAKGLERICTDILLVSYATFSPEVVYIAVNAIKDTKSLSARLRRNLPPFCDPDVRKTYDYRDAMYLGSAALALKYVAELEKQQKVQSLKRAKTAIDKVHETVSETVKKKLAEH